MARGQKSIADGKGGIDPNVQFQRAVAEYESGRLRKARTALLPLLELPDREGFVTLLAGLIDAGLQNWSSAEARLRSAVELLPRRAEGWMGLGNVQYAREELEAAVESFRRALQIEPDRVPAWNNLALAYAEMGRHHDAASAFALALERDPENEEAAHGRARALFRCARFEEASSAYADLTKRFPDKQEYRLEYAELLGKANRLDAAREVLPEPGALRNPNLVARHEGMRARIVANEGRLEDALQIVKSTYRKTREGWLGYMEGGFLDRQGNPEAAMSAFQRGNEAFMKLRACRRLSKQPLLEYLDHKIEQCMIGLTGADGYSGRSPVFIVGLPRSGTTLLDRMLDAHPGIQVLEEPESLRVAEAVVARGDDIDVARQRYWDYLDDTIGLQSDCVIVDKNPLHSLHLDLLPRLFPDSLVIYSLRHPYDAALSCYMQDFYLNAASVHFLRLESAAALCSRLLRMMELHERARPGNVVRVRYEELVTGDYRDTVRGLLDRVGLAWDPVIEQFAERAAQSGLIKSASHEQVTRGLYTSALERWRRYERWIGEPFRTHLASQLEYWGYRE